MAGVAFVLSLCVAALGALGVLSPARLLAFARQFETTAGLYAAAAFRVVMGVALILAAPTSRAPGIIRILGVAVLVAGLLTPAVGLERARRIILWWSQRGPAFMRAWAGAALLFGLLTAYAVAP
jgi:hypothetical protein